MSIGFGPFVESLSVIVMEIADGEPSETPALGLESVIEKLSLPSAYESSTRGIEIVFEVSPAAKFSVPRVVS